MLVKRLINIPETDLNYASPHNGNTPLIYAAFEGFTTMVEELLQYAPHRVNINAKNKKGTSALAAAASNNHYRIVKLLCKHSDTYLNIVNDNHCTPFYLAASKGHIDIVNELLKYYPEKIDIMIPDINNNTPLHVACHGNHLSVVERLCKLSILDLNIPGNSGVPPIIIAITNKHINIVKELLSHNERINVNVCSPQGLALIHLCINSNQFEIFQLLCAHPNIDLNIATKDNKLTPLALCVVREQILFIKEILKYKDKLNLNCQDMYGNTPFYTAIANRNMQIFQLLCTIKGFDPNIKNRRGQFGLIFATIQGTLEYFDAMLKYYKRNKIPLNINAVDNDGNTALHWSMHLKDLAIMTRLHSEFNDLDSDIKNNKGLTPEDLAPYHPPSRYDLI